MNNVLLLRIKKKLESSTTQDSIPPQTRTADTTLTFRIIYQEGVFYLLNDEKMHSLQQDLTLSNDGLAVDIQLENTANQTAMSNNNETLEWKNFMGSDTELLLEQLQINKTHNFLSTIQPDEDPLAFLYSSSITTKNR